MSQHPVGYDAPDSVRDQQDQGGWWRSVVKPGLEAFDDIEKPSGGGEWSCPGEA